jgi:hypothetical protein
MQIFCIIATSMLATLAFSALVADTSSRVAEASGSTELIDPWQDTYVLPHLIQLHLHVLS